MAEHGVEGGLIERPCIRCGVVDEVKNMVRLSGYQPTDLYEEYQFEVWAHVACYHDYNEVSMQLGSIAADAYAERLKRERQERLKKGKG